MREALLLHSEAQMIIHLGDGERDIGELAQEIGSRKLIQVCGNCDLYSQLPYTELVIAAGIRILCTHGHTEGVKHSTEPLIEKARAAGARIALYGHTHQSVTDYRDGLHIMNPGSARVGEYGAIDITPSGIMLLKMSV